MAHRTSSTAFHDFLFNMLLIFVVLFVMAFFLIRPPATPPADITTTDQLVFKLTWDDMSKTDLDMWIQLPTTEMLAFKSKDASIGQLERDDRGWDGDMAIINGEEKVLFQNLEVARIRNLMDGDYLVSVFMYSDQENKGIEEFTMEIVDPDNHRILVRETGSVYYRGEIPVARIHVAAGQITDVDTIVDHKLVNQRATASSTGQQDRIREARQRQVSRDAAREAERAERHQPSGSAGSPSSYSPGYGPIIP